MSNIIIKAENLGKAYQLGQIGTGTISRDLERWYALLRGKEDPFLRIGETNDRTKKGGSDVVWSLRDINFEIEQGDAVGIIGRNGAGKSTLLKILSRVTSPTTGKIKGYGRVASLLEVGTGFHPELSGRENIFLNGAILGMRKKEIQRKLEEIVDFASIERYLDTPVKRYSSGMYVRLAFAVAAHLESEILIVDEVLAVGDMEFQQKCLGKMGEVSKGDGRTVLFVSHNIGAIRSLCNKGILLENGTLSISGNIHEVIRKYSMVSDKKQAAIKLNGPLTQFIDIFNISVNGKSNFTIEVLPETDIVIELSYKIKEEINDLLLIIAFFAEGQRLFTNREDTKEKPVVGEVYKSTFVVNKHTLRPGNYAIAVGGLGNNEAFWIWGLDIVNVKVEEVWSEGYFKADEGVVHLPISTFRTKL